MFSQTLRVLLILINFCSKIYFEIFFSYIVGKIQLKATEICIAKGIIQSMIYGIICFTQYLNTKRKGRPLENIEDQVKSPMKIFDVWAFLFCLFVAIMTIAAYLGLKLMPVPDFVVFGHTSPVYTVLFSACILRYVLHSFFRNKIN